MAGFLPAITRPISGWYNMVKLMTDDGVVNPSPARSGSGFPWPPPHSGPRRSSTRNGSDTATVRVNSCGYWMILPCWDVYAAMRSNPSWCLLFPQPCLAHFELFQHLHRRAEQQGPLQQGPLWRGPWKMAFASPISPSEYLPVIFWKSPRTKTNNLWQPLTLLRDHQGRQEQR